MASKTQAKKTSAKRKADTRAVATAATPSWSPDTLSGDTFGRAIAGDERAQARYMASWLGHHAEMLDAGTSTNPLVALVWKVFYGSDAERRLTFLRGIDRRATFPNGADPELNALLDGWREDPRYGPKAKKTDKTVWDLVAARWKKITGEDVAGVVFMRAWSRRPADPAPIKHVRPLRPRLKPRTR